MNKATFYAALAVAAIAIFVLSAGQAQALTWERVNTSGFDTATQRLVLAPTTEWGDYLYAGTGGTTDDGNMANIWRTSNGTEWTKVTADGFGDANNNWVAGIVIFNGDLYAKVVNNVTGVEIWRTRNGTDWQQVSQDGFGKTANTGESFGLVVFNDKLYATVCKFAVSTELWHTENGTTWTQDDISEFTAAGNTNMYDLMVYGDTMYAGSYRAAGAQIWKSTDGSTWTSLMTNGFGDSNNIAAIPLFRFKENFYSMTFNTITGVEAWRSADATTWSRANSDGFGATGTDFPSPFPAAANGTLYVGLRNTAQGAALYRSNNGTTWETELSGGAGNTNNQASYSITFWKGRLYVGFSTFSAGTNYAQIWRSEELPTLEISNTSLAGAIVNESYSQTLTTNNGMEPYSWEIIDGALPEGLTLDSNTGVISGTPIGVGSEEITVRVTDGGMPAQTAEKTFTIRERYLVTGTGIGSTAHVRVFDTDGSEQYKPHSLFAYSPSYRSGVNVASGDVNGDGQDEIITAPRIGGAPWIRVFSKEGRAIGAGLKPYGNDMTAGIDVAAADVNGDGKDEIIVVPEMAEKTTVKVYQYNAAKTKIGQWDAFGSVYCGAHVAAGDLDGDHKAEVIVSANAGNVPAVRIYRYDGKAKGVTYMAFEKTYQGGVDVSAGDVNGDGKAELGVSKLLGQSVTKVVKWNKTFTALGRWDSYPKSAIGSRISMGDIDRDGLAEVVTMANYGGSPQVRGYEATGNFIRTTNFFAYSKAAHNGGDIAVGDF